MVPAGVAGDVLAGDALEDWLLPRSHCNWLTLQSLAAGRQRAGGDEFDGGGRCGSPHPVDSGVIHCGM